MAAKRGQDHSPLCRRVVVVLRSERCSCLRVKRPTIDDACCTRLLTNSGRLMLRICKPVAPLRQEPECDGSVAKDDDTCERWFHIDKRSTQHAIVTETMLRPGKCVAYRHDTGSKGAQQPDQHSIVWRETGSRSPTCVEGTAKPRRRRVAAAELLVSPWRCDVGSRLDLRRAQEVASGRE